MKQKLIFAILISAVCLTGFTSCDDDNDNIAQELAAPSVTPGAATYHTLEFNWEAVPNTIQYGYKLIDPNGTSVKAGVTRSTAITISGLQPSTTYTLQVWAFAGLDTDYATSPAKDLTATTADIIKLATPTPTLSEDGGKQTIVWDAVADAQTYAYTVTSADGTTVVSGTTADTYYTPAGLEEGDYTFTVKATTTDGAFSDSDSASATFHIDKKPLYSIEGTFTSVQFNKSWSATMVAYADGSYSIQAFFGVEGYNFDFSVNADGTFNMLVGEARDDGGFKYWSVPTGLASPAQYYIYPWDGFCSMVGDRSSGEIWIGNYYGDDWTWGEDSFVWDSTKSMSVDDLAGTYTNHAQGITYFNDSWTQEEFDYPDYAATITKVDDNTITIDGLYYTDCPVTGTVDFTAMTITIEPQPYADYYTFASESGADSSVVATINEDGSIDIPYFCVWHEGSWYLWCKNTLTKNEAAKTVKKSPPQRPK